MFILIYFCQDRKHGVSILEYSNLAKIDATEKAKKDEPRCRVQELLGEESWESIGHKIVSCVFGWQFIQRDAAFGFMNK